MELVVVVAILAFLAGMVSFNLTPNQLTFGGAGGNKTAGRIATEVTLARLKSAMFGSADSPGYWQDMNRDMWFWPRYLEWLSRAPSDAADISGASADSAAYFTSMMSFNASRRVGWRGPYMQFQGDIIPLDTARGFTARLGGGVYRAPLDAWGNPVVMQWPSSYFGLGTVDFGDARGDATMAVFIASNSRLVSAGPDGILQTELNINSLQTYDDFQLNPALVGDDIVLWLQH
jgi:type II secretory pathway pseudopilin PulG